jgi:catechol 2,3-dioxygenase-like lactoylglutathione lyase family enzyme
MNVGWCDVCLRVKDVRASRTYYDGLGFRRVEGEDDEGWAVVTNDDLRLGLFEEQHMGDSPISLNFRGGDVFTIAQELANRGYSFASGPKGTPDGAASASLRDPDGYLIFFDSAPGEKMPV